MNSGSQPLIRWDRGNRRSPQNLFSARMSLVSGTDLPNQHDFVSAPTFYSLKLSSDKQHVCITDFSTAPPEPPTLELDIREKMMVKVGDSCTVSGRFSGRPVPAITWTKNSEELKADEQINLHSTAHHLSLNIINARREHSGCYGVNVENAAGSRSGMCTITVVGKSPLYDPPLKTCIKKVFSNIKDLKRSMFPPIRPPSASTGSRGFQ